VSLRSWFRLLPARQQPRLRLVCFPHAGGSASFFRSWATHLPGAVELAAVCYPGHEGRIQDPLAEHMKDLAGPLAEACERLPAVPTAFFGHSMGAMVAYETALRLERAHGIGLSALCVSACRAPGRERRREPVPDDDDELAREILRMGGTEQAVLLSAEMRQLVLPIIRADLRLVQRYDACASLEAISAPLVACYGVADEGLDDQSVRAWAAFTRAHFILRAMPGGHFYLNDDTAGFVRDLIAQVTRTELRDSAECGRPPPFSSKPSTGSASDTASASRSQATTPHHPKTPGQRTNAPITGGTSD
jgi:pyochelin biosynthesis protein PchC